ncbi:RNA polymerase sigma factor [Yonghaparkia sp. Soil809]|uniref:RNA polymerase sigma factor n=1 Tax=Yonghaparkia sp. Soil809 TaxID=1736417 RepID=UPI001911039E|nr:sigma-70 family RNA polymerase sigma factor [Yonghaparkia sp. Soil809]
MSTSTDRERRMRALVDLLADPVRRYLHRRTDAATADDVLGDVLLVCWRRLDEVPPAEADALPWAIVVARQCLANAQRAERRRTRLVGRIIAIDPPPIDAPDAAADDDDPHGDDHVRLRAALARLRRDDAEILRLWAWDELTSPQIAVVLGISANAASIRLHRAKARLKAELSDESHAALKAAASSGHVREEEGSIDVRR